MPKFTRENVENEHTNYLYEKGFRRDEAKGTLYFRTAGALGISLLGPFSNAWDGEYEYQWGSYGGKSYANKLIIDRSLKTTPDEMVESDWLSVQGIITAIRLTSELKAPEE